MSFNRIGKAFGTTVAVAAIATVSLSACGSDNNATSSSGSDGGSSSNCAGKKSLKASGSSAQANAMTRFCHRLRGGLPRLHRQLHLQWIRRGVSEFIGGQTDFGGTDSPLNPDKGEVEKAGALRR